MAQPLVFRGRGYDLPWLRALRPGRRSSREILPYLRNSKAITEAVRRRALAIAERRPDNMGRLTDAAWNLVRWRGGSAETYRSNWQVMEVVGPGHEISQGTEPGEA